jgi:hypothetical protein
MNGAPPRARIGLEIRYTNAEFEGALSHIA